MPEQTDEIWASMKGAAPLREIYGYWPTLHDALIQAIDIDFGLRQLIFTFDYSDLVDDHTMRSIGTRISMRWGGVQEAKLSEYSEDLYGVDFFRRGTIIETRFAEYEFGLDGYILAETIEVLKVEQPRDDFFNRKKIKLSFK